jgi:hypothetical protein
LSEFDRKHIEKIIADTFCSGQDIRFDEAAQDVVDQWVDSLKITKDTSDGYHTFRDLYMHRMALTLGLATELSSRDENNAWRSMYHHPDDAPMFEDSFIVGIVITPIKVITYHFNLKFWDLFSDIQTLEHAPKWDGAAPEDTVERLLTFYAAPEAIMKELLNG